MIVEIILGAIFIVLSLVWMYVGIFQLGIWVPGVKASAGLVPTVFAALVLVFSVFMVLSAVKKLISGEKKEEKKAISLPKVLESILPVVFGIVGIFVFEYFGVVVFTFTLSFLWLLLLSRKKWTFALLVAVILTLFMYLVFELWLKIPFPGRIFKL